MCRSACDAASSARRKNQSPVGGRRDRDGDWVRHFRVVEAPETKLRSLGAVSVAKKSINFLYGDEKDPASSGPQRSDSDVAPPDEVVNGGLRKPEDLDEFTDAVCASRELADGSRTLKRLRCSDVVQTVHGCFGPVLVSRPGTCARATPRIIVSCRLTSGGCGG